MDKTGLNQYALCTVLLRLVTAKKLQNQICKLWYLFFAKMESFIYDLVFNLYINLACLRSVCLFVSNKRLNGLTDRAQIFFGTPCDPREGLWIIKFQKFSSIKIRFLKILKIHKKFLKIREIFCFCYLLTRRTPVYFISNKKFYKWNKRWARSALKG